MQVRNPGGSILLGEISCAEDPLNTPFWGEGSVSLEASNQLISGSQVGVQVTLVSGAVTPTTVASSTLDFLSPTSFQLLHFLTWSYTALSPDHQGK